ncbi:MAG: hypothetical protein ACFFHV_08390 [Promethearchaeota archaeon]
MNKKTLSPIGWLNSLTGSCVVIFGCMFGLYFMYKSKQSNAKLLFFTGILTIFVSLLYLGQFIDFLAILITGENLHPYQLYAILCYIWVAPAVIFGFYLGAEIIIPERKKVIVIIYTFIGIIFEVFLFLDTNNSFIFRLPAHPGEDIIDVNFNRTSPTFILIVFFLLSALIFNGVGFIYKSFQSTGIIRKRFLFLSIGWIMFVLAGALDSLTSPGIGLFLVRIGMLSSSWFWYFGLREEKVKAIEISNKKSMSEESDITLIERLSLLHDEQLSEKDVNLYREQIICLVCKGDALGFVYICPDCKALYCEKCARSLIDLENACWICNCAIDKSKPVKIYKKKEIEDFKKQKNNLKN